MAIPESDLVVTADFLTVRNSNSVYAPKLGYLPKGSRVSVLETRPGLGSTAGWCRVRVDVRHSVKDVVLHQQTAGPLEGWVSKDWLAPIVVTPPPPGSTRKMGMGVNVITGDEGVALRALSAGCTAISGINMFGQLAALAKLHPDKTFMGRRYISSFQEPDPDRIFEGAWSKELWYLCPNNECDVICNGTPDQIRQRAAWDKVMFERMKARGARYAGGAFSVGTADYTNPAVVAAMRECYAPLYNAGMGFNGHFYTPWQTHKMDEWYEGRWRFLFGDGPMSCGFNPDPNLAGIFCDEAGLDQGSLGGFAAANWSAAQVEQWCKDFMSYSQAPPYAGLFRAAVIFQAGNTTDWRGYNVDTPDMLKAIGNAAQAPIAEWVTPRMAAPEEVPVMILTLPKLMSQWAELGY